MSNLPSLMMAVTEALSCDSFFLIIALVGPINRLHIWNIKFYPILMIGGFSGEKKGLTVRTVDEVCATYVEDPVCVWWGTRRDIPQTLGQQRTIPDRSYWDNLSLRITSKSVGHGEPRLNQASKLRMEEPLTSHCLTRHRKLMYTSTTRQTRILYTGLLSQQMITWSGRLGYHRLIGSCHFDGPHDYRGWAPTWLGQLWSDSIVSVSVCFIRERSWRALLYDIDSCPSLECKDKGKPWPCHDRV